MTAAVVQQLAVAVIWMGVGSLATWLVMSVRRDRADAARENERVEVDYAPILARIRPVIDAASHLRPAAAGVVRRHRQRIGAKWRAFVARWSATPVPTAAGPLALPAPTTPAVAPAGHFAALDTNSRDWPVNTALASVPQVGGPVGRVHMPLDFDVWVNRTRDELRRHTAALAADPDATGYLPKVHAEEVAR